MAWGDYDNDGDLDILLTGFAAGLSVVSGVYRNDAGAFTDIAAGLTGVTAGSVAWGDYDNDGDLDILLAGWTGSAAVSNVYRNDAGVFTDIAAGLTNVSDGSVAWGDYDNDGDLDILLTGASGVNPVSKVYRNDAGAFTDIAAGLTNVYASSVAWGDYDNDGDYDILLAGYSNGGTQVSGVFRNDAGVFTDIAAGLTGIRDGTVSWGDYDSDGDLDILLSGDAGGTYVSRVYRNDAGAFTDIGAGLAGVYFSSVAWGDYDNDGDLDILLSGYAGGTPASSVYRNDTGAFTDIAAGLTGVGASSAAWGDYDNDGDLDILLAGNTESGPVSSVYRNDTGSAANTIPTAPTNLSATWSGTTLTLSWDPATDTETPAAGLSYNVYVGTSPLGHQVAPSLSDNSTGYRRVAQLGNAQQKTSWILTPDNPPGGDLYWGVQAVDGGFAGSSFASEQVFVPPFTDIGAGLASVRWGSTAWGDYDNDGDLDILLTGCSSGPHISRVYRNDAGAFIDIAAGLIGVCFSSVAWGDYDNDGDLDILLSGTNHSGVNAARVYRNDAGVFTDIAAGLPPVVYSSVAWGDYDNDGDLDILLSGYIEVEMTQISRVYRNDAGAFTDIAAGLTGVYSGSVAWGDYDNDGDLDILLTGHAGGPMVSSVYRNDAGAFTDIAAGLAPVPYGTVAWGDYDNDGDLDILLAESTGSTVYRNDAGAFADIAAGMIGVNDGAVAWGDYDNDGDLDILLSGYAGGTRVSRVYRNDAGAFTDIGAGLIGVSENSAAWGDYDNDGDLDILLTGFISPGANVSSVYRNDTGSPANTIPTAPTNLSATWSGTTLTLSWDPATDTETPAAGLSYNVYVGTSPLGHQVAPSLSDNSTGYRRVVQLGNAQQKTSWILTPDNPPGGDLYWGVQAIDGALAGSPFAAEQQVTPGVGVEDEPPVAFALGSAVPNPFVGKVRVEFSLPVATMLTLSVFDASGRKVRDLASGTWPAGRHGVAWDGTDTRGRRVAPGLYLCRLRAGAFKQSRRMVLMH